jgi:Uma2 family endonuclease
MTLTKFLDWDPEDPSGCRWQLIDGEPSAMAPGTETHAVLRNEIGRRIANHLFERGGKCRLLSQPGIVPRIRANGNFRIPDLAVTCAPPALGLMVPDPILLIEIPSPSNEAQTRSNIWAYTTIPSVQILAVHSTRIEAELPRRDADGTWPEEPDTLTAAGDRLTLQGIDSTTSPGTFYRTTALA